MLGCLLRGIQNGSCREKEKQGLSDERRFTHLHLQRRRCVIPCVKVESLLDDADLSVQLSREKFESLNDELFTRSVPQPCPKFQRISLALPAY